ncbi:MAG: AI-2E family transporter [Myxococcota bacterium]
MAVVFPRDPNEPRLVRWTRNPRVRQTVILTSLWVAILAVLVLFHTVLLPFGLAILIAFIIEPIVSAASARKVFGRSPSRALVVIGIYVVMAAGFYGFLRSVAPEIGREVSKIGASTGNTVAELRTWIGTAMTEIRRFAAENDIPIDQDDLDAFLQQNTDALSHLLSSSAGSLFLLGRNVAFGLVQAIFGSFLVLMLTAFISADKNRIQTFFASLVPPNQLSAYGSIVRGITTGLAGVVRGQVLICITNGLLTFVGLWVLGVKFPFVLAIVATTMSLIPIFGSILSTIPIVAVALTDSFPKAIFALLWIIGIHLLEANFLNPKILGNAAKIHPVVVVFSLIAGERTYGLIGALFAVPIASVLLAIFKFLHAQAREPERPPLTTSLPPPASPVLALEPPSGEARGEDIPP